MHEPERVVDDGGSGRVAFGRVRGNWFFQPANRREAG